MANLRQCQNYTHCLKSLNPPRIQHIHNSASLAAFCNRLSVAPYHCCQMQTYLCNSLKGNGGCASVSHPSAFGWRKSSQFRMPYIHDTHHPRFSTKAEVTLDNIFSESNKKRLQDHLLTVNKLTPQNKKSDSGSKTSDAAVLVPLCTVEGEPSVLFTLRSTSLRKHRGQVSFPGGMMDETDRDAVHTALRETQEELGIAMETVDVWGTMMDLPTRDNKLVTPVLGYCGEMDISTLTLSEDEVELVFTRTVQSLCHPKNVGHTQFRNGYTMPVFLGGEHRIWGLTSFILHQTLTNLAPGLYRFKLRYRS